MAAFSYVSGNPSNLTGGGLASMVDVQGPFTDIRTVLNNGAAFDYGNFTSVVDSYYKTIREGGGLAASAAGIYVCDFAGGLATNGAAGTGASVFYLDPAHYPSGTRTPKLQLAASLVVNATASVVTFTYGLYPVTAVGGAGDITATLGTVVAMSADKSLTLQSLLSCPRGGDTTTLGPPVLLLLSSPIRLFAAGVVMTAVDPWRRRRRNGRWSATGCFRRGT
jgi:hypothetical protein